MSRHVRALVLSAILATATAAVVAASRPAATRLTVHEWGTFTSVAGPTGQSVDWTPLSGPQDLPCFVSHQDLTSTGLLTSLQVKGRDLFGLLKLLPNANGPAPAPAVVVPPPPVVPPPAVVAKIRMETPVLYFYTPEAMTVHVNVAFRQGAMSEWYPSATVPALKAGQALTLTTGRIDWPEVEILPNATDPLPRDDVKSHYYAARDVDAAPVRVGNQIERFLFYRGLADFQPSIQATIARDGRVNASLPAGAGQVVLFENRHGRIRYGITRAPGAQVTLTEPHAGTVASLRSELESVLVAEGLYPREAAAMVATWQDSWFEEGTRLFYVLPRAEVDDRLPLTISPAPSSITRVFVGRLELITEEMKDDVERAILKNDLDTLTSYGRFLDSIVLQMADRPSIAEHRVALAGALRSIALSHPPALCQ